MASRQLQNVPLQIETAGLTRFHVATNQPAFRKLQGFSYVPGAFIVKSTIRNKFRKLRTREPQRITIECFKKLTMRDLSNVEKDRYDNIT